VGALPLFPTFFSCSYSYPPEIEHRVRLCGHTVGGGDRQPVPPGRSRWTDDREGLAPGSERSAAEALHRTSVWRNAVAPFGSSATTVSPTGRRAGWRRDPLVARRRANDYRLSGACSETRPSGASAAMGWLGCLPSGSSR